MFCPLGMELHFDANEQGGLSPRDPVPPAVCLAVPSPRMRLSVHVTEAGVVRPSSSID